MQTRIETNKLILTLLSLIYLSQCFRIIFLPEIFKFVIYFTTILINFTIFYGLRNFHFKRLGITAIIFLLLLCIGVANGNWVNFIFADFLNFSILFIILLKRENLDDFITGLVNIFAVLSLVGAGCAIIYLNSIGFSAATSLKSRLTFDTDAEVLFLKNALAVCRVSVFLLPFVWSVNSIRKVLIISSVAVFFAVSVMMLSRAGVGAVTLSVILTLAVGIKKRKIKLITIFLLFVSVIALIAIARNLFQDFFLLFELIERRFLGIEYSQGQEQRITDPRDIEAFYFYKSLSIFEWIFGRGFGGTNTNPFGKMDQRGLAMLHRGENMLILKGGILLLVTCYGTLVYSFAKLVMSNLKYSAPFASCILIYFLLERGHNQIGYMFSTIFVVLAVHYALSTLKKKVS